MPDISTAQVQAWIERLNAGDLAARDALITHTLDRLRRLAYTMFQDFRRLGPWADFEDVLQDAVVRLLRALETEKPASVQAFFRLAALQIRRELLDLARHVFGAEGSGAHRAPDISPGRPEQTSLPPLEKQETTYEPSRLAAWSEFHERVGALPEAEREVFELLWYQGLKQEEAAALLHVSVPTIKRRWLGARRALGAVLRAAESGA
jgi:RNA polymerase sigma factor (sigma-70 family)